MVAPVVITHHGRDRLILTSIVDFEAGRAAPGDRDDAETLAQERARRLAPLEHIQECFLSFDGDFHILHANYRAELYYGLTLDGMRGRDLRDLSPFKGDAIAWEYYAKMLRLTHEPVAFQVKSELHKGSTLAVVAFLFDGEVGALFSSTNPHEEALRCVRQGNALSAALALDPGLSEIRLNVRGGIIEVGESFAALAGFPQAQLQTMMLAEVLHPHDRPLVHRTFDAVMRDDSAATVQARLLVRDGGVRKLRLNFSAVPGDIHAASAIAIAVDMGPDAD